MKTKLLKITYIVTNCCLLATGSDLTWGNQNPIPLYKSHMARNFGNVNIPAQYVLQDINKPRSEDLWTYVLDLASDNAEALQNRENMKAYNIALKLSEILSNQIIITKDQTLNENLFDWYCQIIEQIELSTRDKPQTSSLFKTKENNLPHKQNIEILKTMYDTARSLTNTQLLSQIIALSMLKHPMNLKIDNLNLTKSILEKINFIFQDLQLIVCQEHAGYENITKLMIESKKKRFIQFLDDLTQFIGGVSQSDFIIKDVGQTSEGHCNTCFWNSTFHSDLIKRNIPNTKLSTLSMALNSMKSDGKIFKKSPVFHVLKSSGGILFTGQEERITRLQSQHSAEAEYYFSAELVKNTLTGSSIIFPGVIGNCSIVEAQCYATKQNALTFLQLGSNRIIQGYPNNSIIHKLQGGYIWSEHLPFALISSSLYHAQSMQSKSVPLLQIR